MQHINSIDVSFHFARWPGDLTASLGILLRNPRNFTEDIRGGYLVLSSTAQAN
ncbi:hypothetical protein XM38_028470 [Halomicronema hongdechloris C2206]|uniref:Uncharacterized protein n=1 Tax=Halomicronema hongdechloris C2206 TaxID=1641165 RepID=A0A1Z3HNK7_9CYAN|nr:hypothetical protein XM38_028470 [Halomicronema hongdechloris C2206]